MAHRKKHTGPVPPGNRSKRGPGAAPPDNPKPLEGEVTSAQEQDPKRRIGDYEQTGEHALQQPGGKNDANR